MSKVEMFDSIIESMRDFKKERKEDDEVIKFIPIEQPPIIEEYPVKPRCYSESIASPSIKIIAIISIPILSILIMVGLYIIGFHTVEDISKYQKNKIIEHEKEIKQKKEKSIVDNIDNFKKYNLGKLLINTNYKKAYKINYIDNGIYPVNAKEIENKGRYDIDINNGYVEMDGVPKNRCNQVVNDNFAISGYYDYIEINDKLYDLFRDMKYIYNFCNMEKNIVKWHKAGQNNN